MKPREAYVRVTVRPTQGVECVVGLEHRPDERVLTHYALLTAVVKDAVSGMDDAEDEVLAEWIEDALRCRFPDRAFFIEVGRDPHDCWVQVFQPWGVPRSA